MQLFACSNSVLTVNPRVGVKTTAFSAKVFGMGEPSGNRVATNVRGS